MITCVCIAVDIMGGDNDPIASVSAVLDALTKHHNVSFLLFGNTEVVPSDMLQKCQELGCRFVHTDKYISCDEKPSSALRNSQGTSMRMAIEAVKDGRAQAVISSGNTGALMSISRMVLRMIHKSIERPAICALIPNLKGFATACLDLGANSDCTPEQLLQFAIMGCAFFQSYSGRNKATCALLNIGSEDTKGSTLVKKSHELISKANVGGEFLGYVEADMVLHGPVDVVICDGFTGNIFLKGIEGVSHVMKRVLKETFSASIFTKLAYKMIERNLLKSMKMMDNKIYNGAMLVGLDGICVKSHGNSDAKSFGSAINIAVSLARSKVNDRIKEHVEKLGDEIIKN